MGVKISNLPAIVTPALSDIFPVVQAGVTYKESLTQLTSLFATSGANSNITSLSGLSSITFSPTTGGIVGTPTNDNVAAGKVGEMISSVIAEASAVSLTTTVSANVTSISLTAGDWDVWGNVAWTANGVTNTTSLIAWISTTSATVPPSEFIAAIDYGSAGVVASTRLGLSAPSFRMSLASTTTVYLSSQGVFTISTLDAFGGIYARRRR